MPEGHCKEISSRKLNTQVWSPRETSGWSQRLEIASLQPPSRLRSSSLEAGTTWRSSEVGAQRGESLKGKSGELHHALYAINTGKCPLELIDRNVFSGTVVNKPNYNGLKSKWKLKIKMAD